MNGTGAYASQLKRTCPQWQEPSIFMGVVADKPRAGTSGTLTYSGFRAGEARLTIGFCKVKTLFAACGNEPQRIERREVPSQLLAGPPLISAFFPSPILCRRTGLPNLHSLPLRSAT